MGRRCCIAGCNSTSRLPEHHGVTYHSFPLDAIIRTVWIRNTRLSAERQITKSVLVCSRHFRRADFHPMRSGKYLLKQRVFPTVFPWGRVDPQVVETDLEQLKATGGNLPASTADDPTKATVEATVAQIMAETAELNAASGKATTTAEGSEVVAESVAVSSPIVGSKFEPVTAFNPGSRLEAQDFDGVWHSARIVEVDNDDREVLIKFERTGKNKSTIVGTEEWIPMNSSRLRQKVSIRPIPIFELEEKCMARWSGPRKFPGTVQKILDNDTYEILFDDGYVKNVRAIHMNKVTLMTEAVADSGVATTTAVVAATTAATVPVVDSASLNSPQILTATPVTTTPTPTVVRAPKRESPVAATGASQAKKRTVPGQRKDWPLLDMSKLDLEALKLPEIPHDGEWTCHWVNDQPIGREGYLIVGEHRKPTVIVDDWRLPQGWIKHMYQRSNVLGKWDVILVSPTNKRFRSKADLKTFLEEHGQVYNPDIYDFSIHRRRAKDIFAYAHTPDYTPQQSQKPKQSLDATASTSVVGDLTINDANTAALASSLAAASSSSTQYIETPVATAMPPMELMTPTLDADKTAEQHSAEAIDVPNTSALIVDGSPPVDDGFAFIGGLKVQIIDNLFRCPQEGCSKNFRKENHLQIHVKHYHQDLIKLLGACPKMQELAEKRTHPVAPDQNEPQPKNQISNQQFFAKLHQQDLEQTRSHRRSAGGATTTSASATGVNELVAATTIAKTEELIESGTEAKIEKNELYEAKFNVTADSNTIVSEVDNIIANSTANSPYMDLPLISTTADESGADLSVTATPLLSKRARFSTSKRTPGSRKSSRQRTTRRYLTAAQATGGAPLANVTMPTVITADSSFGTSDFEETRHSFNATPDAKILMSLDSKKRLPLSSIDSPVTADSGSSSFQLQQLQAAVSSNEADISSTPVVAQQQHVPQYIKENGELIKIVRMRQEEIINCLCSYGEEDGLMIQCELCLCWQHGVCNGIDKESDVPEKYVCYVCRNPQRGRDSMRFKHDQDWLYEGKLPVANYHLANPDLPKRFEFLKKSHTLTGNLIELKRFMHSLHVKINIANNRCHPKLYLWAKKWDDDENQRIKGEHDVKLDELAAADNIEMKSLAGKQHIPTTPTTGSSLSSSPAKRIKSEPSTPARPMPNIPQPEAPIDPVECQHRLLEHIKVQQSLVMNRLNDIETAIDALEDQDELPDLKQTDISSTKDILATFIKELDTMKQIAKLNALEHTKQALKNPMALK